MQTAWYPSEPEAVTYMALPDGTADVWLREGITETGTEYDSMTKAELLEAAEALGASADSSALKADVLAAVKAAAGAGWECEEVYFRTTLSEEEVVEGFGALFANGGPAVDEEGTESVSEPTLSERIDAIEAAILELAEVVANG